MRKKRNNTIMRSWRPHHLAIAAAKQDGVIYITAVAIDTLAKILIAAIFISYKHWA